MLELPREIAVAIATPRAVWAAVCMLVASAMSSSPSSTVSSNELIAFLMLTAPLATVAAIRSSLSLRAVVWSEIELLISVRALFRVVVPFVTANTRAVPSAVWAAVWISVAMVRPSRSSSMTSWKASSASPRSAAPVSIALLMSPSL